MTGGEKVKQVRNELHLKQRAFAKRVGVTPQTIVNWEKKESLSDREISLICLKFGVREGFFEDGGNIFPDPPRPPHQPPIPSPFEQLEEGFDLTENDIDFIEYFCRASRERKDYYFGVMKTIEDITPDPGRN